MVRQQQLAQHAQQRAVRKHEKKAAQQEHKAAVKRAKPRLRRTELRKVGQEFAARGSENVRSKSSAQLSQAPAFIVPVSTARPSEQFPPLCSESNEGKQASGTRRVWTERGLLHSPDRMQFSTPFASICTKEKPWRLRSVQRCPSDLPSVQIFVPAVSEADLRSQPTAFMHATRPHGDAQAWSHALPALAGCTDQGGIQANQAPVEACPASFGSPFQRLQQLSCLAGATAPSPSRRSTPPSPECSPINRQRAALTDMQALLAAIVPDSREAVVGSCADVATNNPSMRPATEQELDARHSISSSGCLAAGMQAVGGAGSGVTAVKIEELRMKLEIQLGPEKLLAAYTYLQQFDSQEHDKVVQVKLEQLLSPDEHLAYSIYKLLTLEQLVFGN
jgi:hypothetical protein